jgi:hypothetical protein
MFSFLCGVDNRDKTDYGKWQNPKFCYDITEHPAFFLTVEGGMKPAFIITEPSSLNRRLRSNLPVFRADYLLNGNYTLLSPRPIDSVQLAYEMNGKKHCFDLLFHRKAESNAEPGGSHKKQRRGDPADPATGATKVSTAADSETLKRILNKLLTSVESIGKRLLKLEERVERVEESAKQQQCECTRRAALACAVES